MKKRSQLVAASCFPCVLSASPTIGNAYHPILSRWHCYCCQNGPFDLQGSQRQHGCLIQLPMLDHGAAFFRKGPENGRPCHCCCSPDWSWCSQYRSRNNLSWSRLVTFRSLIIADLPFRNPFTPPIHPIIRWIISNYGLRGASDSISHTTTR